MKYILLVALATLGLTACTQFDEYLPRSTQCVLLDTAKAAALAKGIDVDTYLRTEDVFICVDEVK